MSTHTIQNEDEMRMLAEDLAHNAKGGDVIGLVGDLGAGKTTFAKSFVAALGHEGEVRSPTFVLMQHYETNDEIRGRGIEQICHVDAYRIENETELWTAGLDEHLADEATVTLIEWADRAPKLQEHAQYTEIHIDFGEGSTRKVEIKKTAK